MPRVKRGNKRRLKRKKILRRAKGYYLAKSKLYRIAREQVMRSERFAYRDRRQKKRQFRQLWVVRINAAAREHGLSYSRFIAGLKKAAIDVDRKVLADLAIHEKEAFAVLAEQAKTALVDGSEGSTEAQAA